MNEETATKVAAGIQISSLLNHLRNPQNLLTYMIFTAWCKFMGVAQYIPTVSIG